MAARFFIALFFLSLARAQSDEVFLVFYPGPTQADSVRYTTTTFGNVFDHPAFIRTRETTIFSYGNLQSLQTPNVQLIINSYLSAGGRNFIAVDYSLSWILDGGVQRLGDALGIGLLNLYRRGYSSALTHLVGFGTAAHIVSVASLHVTREFHFISRVTGLSPTFTQNQNQIGPGVAQFVDVVHTNTAGHGNFNSRGMASFHVNSGNSQPWCGSDHACSHDVAMAFWAESVLIIWSQFPALSCQSWQDFCNGNCNSNEEANMGVSTRQSARGLYFLQTNNNSPFSRSVATPSGC